VPTNECLLYEEATAGNAKVSCDAITADGVVQYAQRMKLALGQNNNYKNDLDFGQTIAGSSIPVVLATDQSALSMTQSGGFAVAVTGGVPTHGITQVGGFTTAITGSLPNVTIGNPTAAISLTGVNNVVANANVNGGFTPWSVVSLTGSMQTVKSGAAQLNGYYFYNADSVVPAYIKFYNKGSAAVMGTDTPTLRIPIPAGSAANLNIYPGIMFSSGLYVCASSGLADSSTVPCNLNQVVGNCWFI